MKTLSFKDKEMRERVEAVMMSKEEFVGMTQPRNWTQTYFNDLPFNSYDYEEAIKME